MLATLLTIVISFFILLTSADDDFSYSGCYLSSSLQSLGLTSKGSYTWQSPSYCEGQCSGSAFIALSEGGYCYCGSDISILSVSKQSESNCDTSCYGWPDDMCGNSDGGYVNVYVNKNKVNTQSSSSTSASVSTSAASLTGSPSLSSTTLTSSSTSSLLHSHSSLSLSQSVFISTSTLSKGSGLPESTSSIETSTDGQSLSSSSATTTSTSTQVSSVPSTSNSVSSVQLTTKIVTVSVVTTSNRAQSTIVMTATSVIETVVAIASASAYYNGTTSLNNKSTSSLSGGAIAGIVVGCVVGATIIIALMVFYFLYLKRSSRNNVLDIEESKQYQPYSFGEQDANPVFIPGSTGYLNHGSIKSKFNSNSNNSSWKLPSRTSTRNNSNSNLNGSNNNSDVFTKRNASIHSSGTVTNRSIPMGNEIIDDSNGDFSNINNASTFTNPSALKTHIMRRSQLPSTVFEEPTNMSFYDGVQRFSTSSLPDMMEERKPLRIVNPDDSSIRIYDNSDTNENITNHTTESGASTSSSLDDEKY